MSETIHGVGDLTSFSASVAGVGYVHDLGIPSDPGLVEALGRLVIAYTQLELVHRYTVKTLSGLTVTEALDATSNDRMEDLRDRIKQLFRENKPSAQEKCQLDALLQEAKRLTRKRNLYQHSAWSATTSGQALMKSEDNHSWGPAPKKAEVETLALDILAVAKALNLARQSGFIAQVVQRYNERRPQ